MRLTIHEIILAACPAALVCGELWQKNMRNQVLLLKNQKNNSKLFVIREFVNRDSQDNKNVYLLITIHELTIHEPAMNRKKTSYKAYKTARAWLVAVLVPVLLIYLLVDRPGYRLLNTARGIFIPVYEIVADGASWPFRAIGRGIENFRELAAARKENKNLRALLDQALARNNECDLALAENQNLTQKLEIARARPEKVATARVIHDYSALDRVGFILNKGQESGIQVGMAAVSFDGFFVGLVAEAHYGEAFVRSIRDSKSNIPVRITGTDVFGFLRGSGASSPELEFLSDPEFEITDGLKLMTHGIKGSVPDGIPVGRIEDRFIPGTEIGKLTEVMVITR